MRNHFLRAATGKSLYDTDAAAYIAQVEGVSGDNQALETTTKDAINAFVVGCKADGIWTAIKSSCILAGARTLAGALVPLVGTAPTNVGGNFVSGDYDRKTGLVGNGSNKSLRTGLLASGLGNTSHHMFFNASSLRVTGTPGTGFILGGVYNGSTLSSLLDLVEFSGTLGLRELRSGTGGNSAGNSCTINSGLTSSGSVSGSRTSATELRLYQNDSSVAVATNSNTPSLSATAFGVFARNDNGTQSNFSTSRLTFFSFGDGLTQTSMSALHTRVTALITAINAAF
jgi:hypothetical protein